VLPIVLALTGLAGWLTYARLRERRYG